VANIGIAAGLTDGQLFGDIRSAIPAGARHVPDREIMDAVAKARHDIRPYPTGIRDRPMPLPAPRPLIDGPATRDKLIHSGAGAGPEDFWELSPFRPDAEPSHRDALAVLTLYDDREWLFFGSPYDKRVRSVSEWRGIIERCQKAPWPHIMPNPVDGWAHEIGDGKLSFRCDAAVSDLRYAVVEFDNLSKPDQFAFWHSIISKRLLDVAVLLDSGGKSLHAWVRVNLPDRNAWDREIGTQIYGHAGVFTSMGADRACRNPSRLSRLAGHLRQDKGAYQTLLFLNPTKCVAGVSVSALPAATAK
jgi:hypothetical protein